MLWMEKEWAQNGIRDNVAKRMLGGIALCTSFLRSKSTGEVVLSNAAAIKCCQCIELLPVVCGSIHCSANKYVKCFQA
jgi:hypothetical protein